MKKFFKFSWMFVLPAVVAAVIWTSSASESRTCPQVDPLDHTVLLPNPADCSSFFSCSLGVPILMHCPDGLHFNADLDVCDWPSDAGCEIVTNKKWVMNITKRDIPNGTCSSCNKPKTKTWFKRNCPEGGPSECEPHDYESANIHYCTPPKEEEEKE